MVFKDNSSVVKEQILNASRKWIKSSAMVIERDAILLAPVDSGDLKRSIRHVTENDGMEAVIGAEARHGLFVEKGTGEFAENGQGRRGYWVYVTGQPPGPGGKTHTLATAKRAVAFLRSKGLEAYYTNGMHPQPFMEPSFRNNKSNIERLAKKYYAEVRG